MDEYGSSTDCTLDGWDVMEIVVAKFTDTSDIAGSTEGLATKASDDPNTVTYTYFMDNDGDGAADEWGW